MKIQEARKTYETLARLWRDGRDAVGSASVREALTMLGCEYERQNERSERNKQLSFVRRTGPLLTPSDVARIEREAIRAMVGTGSLIVEVVEPRRPHYLELSGDE